MQYFGPNWAYRWRKMVPVGKFYTCQFFPLKVPHHYAKITRSDFKIKRCVVFRSKYWDKNSPFNTNQIFLEKFTSVILLY